MENAIAGINGRMIAFERGIQNGHYACKTKLVPLMEVANVEKKIPRSGSTRMAPASPTALLSMLCR